MAKCRWDGGPGARNRWHVGPAPGSEPAVLSCERDLLSVFVQSSNQLAALASAGALNYRRCLIGFHGLVGLQERHRTFAEDVRRPDIASSNSIVL